MDWIVESAKLLWRDDSWRIAALLLVPTILVSLILDSPVDVIVGGAASVVLLAISTRRVSTLHGDEPRNPSSSG